MYRKLKKENLNNALFLEDNQIKLRLIDFKELQYKKEINQKQKRGERSNLGPHIVLRSNLGWLSSRSFSAADVKWWRSGICLGIYIERELGFLHKGGDSEDIFVI